MKVRLGVLALLMCVFLANSITTQGYHINDSYTNINDASISFSIFEGEYLFVDGMATDCGHCQNQHSVLELLYNSHGDKMRMLSLAIWSRESVSDMQKFVDDYYTPWLAGHDSDQSFATKYNIQGTPTMILFGPTGLEITRWVGETSLEKLQKDIDYVISNQIEHTSSDLPNDIGSDLVDDTSVVERIFTNPLFQATTVFTIFVLFIFKSMKPSEE